MHRDPRRVDDLTRAIWRRTWRLALGYVIVGLGWLLAILAFAGVAGGFLTDQLVERGMERGEAVIFGFGTPFVVGVVLIFIGQPLTERPAPTDDDSDVT